MPGRIKILCTRPLDTALLEEASQRGIDISTSLFIETEPIESVEVQQEIESVFNSSATVIFTSMNAVEAVAENRIDEEPNWSIYCIGHATKKLVEKYFPYSTICGTADNAIELAERIIADEVEEEVVFFCGNQRREELPALLSEQGITVNEIIVYQTVSLPHKVDADCHGILFFSPSAVESFFVKNKALEKTVFFAIGTTTAAAIRKFCGNKILVADSPGKDELVGKMIEYFSA